MGSSSPVAPPPPGFVPEDALGTGRGSRADYEALARRAAQANGLDPDFVSRLIQTESNWNPAAESPAGAGGIMQLMEPTARALGLTPEERFKPELAIPAAMKHLGSLHRKYGGDLSKVAAAYNAGEPAVDSGAAATYPETQAYVRKVTAPPAAPPSPPPGFVPEQAAAISPPAGFIPGAAAPAATPKPPGILSRALKFAMTPLAAGPTGPQAGAAPAQYPSPRIPSPQPAPPLSPVTRGALQEATQIATSPATWATLPIASLAATRGLAGFAGRLGLTALTAQLGKYLAVDAAQALGEAIGTGDSDLVRETAGKMGVDLAALATSLPWLAHFWNPMHPGARLPFRGARPARPMRPGEPPPTGPELPPKPAPRLPGPEPTVQTPSPVLETVGLDEGTVRARALVEQADRMAQEARLEAARRPSAPVEAEIVPQPPAAPAARPSDVAELLKRRAGVEVQTPPPPPGFVPEEALEAKPAETVAEKPQVEEPPPKLTLPEQRAIDVAMPSEAERQARYKEIAEKRRGPPPENVLEGRFPPVPEPPAPAAAPKTFETIEDAAAEMRRRYEAEQLPPGQIGPEGAWEPAGLTEADRQWARERLAEDEKLWGPTLRQRERRAAERRQAAQGPPEGIPERRVEERRAPIPGEGFQAREKTPEERSRDLKGMVSPEEIRGEPASLLSKPPPGGWRPEDKVPPKEVLEARRQEAMAPKVSINEQMNGVEIKFPSIPPRSMIDTLKRQGFRWAKRSRVWYKKNAPGVLETAQTIVGVPHAPQAPTTEPIGGAAVPVAPGVTVTPRLAEDVAQQPEKYAPKPPTPQVPAIPGMAPLGARPPSAPIIAQERPATPERARVAKLFDIFREHAHKGTMPEGPIQARAMAREAVGGDPSTYTDEIFDAAESALAERLQANLKPSDSLDERMAEANRLEAMLPRANRSLEKTDLQQFSTPLPIGVAAGWAADVRSGETLLEPTAGTGNLIAGAPEAQNVKAAELSPRRAELLKAMGFDTTEGDYLKTPIPADVIITNPPWGKYTTGKYGSPVGLEFEPGDVAERFVAKSMRDLKPGGRLVAVMPTTMNGPSGVSFRRWLNASYAVRGLIQSPPGAYKTRATNVESVLLVVDKVPPTADLETLSMIGPVAPENWEAYARAVQKLREEPYARPAAAAKPAEGRPPEAPSAPPRVEPGRAREPERRPPAPIRNASVGQPERPAPLVEEPPRRQEPVAGEEAERAPERIGEQPPKRVSQETARAERGAKGSSSFAPYTRRSSVTGPPHPKLVVEARQLAGVPYPPLTIKPHPKSLAILKAGRLSVEQFEQSMAMVQANIVDHHGYLAADNVGVGKSREIALAVLDLMYRAQDEGRELRLGVGTKGRDNLAQLINEELYYIATGKTLAGVDLAAPTGEEPKKGGAAPKLPFEVVWTIDLPGAKKEGAEYQPPPIFKHALYIFDFPNLAKFRQAMMDAKLHGLIGDEAHKFKNIGGSQAGAAWQQLHAHIIQTVPREQQVFGYFTATPAQRVEDYQYLYGLRLWPIDGFDGYVSIVTGQASETTAKKHQEATEKGAINFDSIKGEDVVGSDATDVDHAEGIRGFGRGATDVFAAQITPSEAEQIPREWKILGRFSSRDLWREGTEFSVHNAKLPAEDRARYDRFVELARRIITAAAQFGRLDKSGKANRFGVRGMLQFAAKRFQLEPALNEAIRLAQEGLKEGYQPIISIINVSESAAEEGNIGAAIEGINTRQVEKDEVEGFVDVGEIPEAVLAKAELLEAAKDLGVLESPIEKITAAFGLENVAFVIGNRGGNRRTEIQEFQEGKRKVAVISSAGATGISLDHRVFTERGVKGRRLFLDTQYEWSATESIQRYGRVDRASQISPPKIQAITFGTASEKKFLAAIANRMAALGALSKGGAESTGATALEEFEISGDEAVASMRDTFQDLPEEDRDLFMGKGFRNPNHPQYPANTTRESAAKFSLELLFMPVEKANEIWEKVMTRLNEIRAAELEEGDVIEKRTARTRGEILRETQLAENLTLFEVQTEKREAAPGEVGEPGRSKYGILSGVVTPEIPRLRRYLADQYGLIKRRYVNFTAGDRVISGLEIRPTRIKDVAGMYGKLAGQQKLESPEQVKEALHAGDVVKLKQGITEGPTKGTPWELHERQDGKIAIRGARMVDRDLLLRNGADFSPVGSFWYIKDAAKFLERFPPAQPEAVEEYGLPPDENPEGGFINAAFFPTLAAGVGRAVKKHLGTREEWYQAQLGDELGRRAYELELLKGIQHQAGEADVSVMVAKQLSREDYFRALAKIPYVGERGAAKILRLARALPKVGARFGVPREQMDALFDAAEGIKTLDSNGTPIFGTKKFERDPKTKEFVLDPQTGDPVWSWRFDPVDAERNFEKLSERAKKAALWWVAEREYVKQAFDVVGGIEGYMHHFFEDGFFQGMRRIKWRYRKASERKVRMEAEGYIRNFERSVEKGVADLLNEKIYNEFLEAFKNTVTRPLYPTTSKNPDDVLLPGWKEIEKLVATTKPDYVGQLAGGRQIPEGMHDEFIRQVRGLATPHALGQLAVDVGRYWKANVLAFNPTSIVTNAVSGGIQYATKVIHDFFLGALTGKFRPFVSDVFAVVDAMRPTTLTEIPPEIFGTDSNIRTQFGSANTFMQKVYSAELWMFGAVENYWKRVIASAVLRAEGKEVSREKLLQDKEALMDLNRVVDRYAFNYFNQPPALEKFKRKWFGALSVPYPTYGYKISRLYTHYLAAFNPFADISLGGAGLPPQPPKGGKLLPGGVAPEGPSSGVMSNAEIRDRLARMLTLAFMLMLIYSAWPEEEERTGRFIPGMPWDLDKTGRTKIGVTKAGKEIYLRTIKYPWMNFVQGVNMASQYLKGETGNEPMSYLWDDFWSTGPLVAGALTLMGLSDRYNTNKTASARWGEIAKTFIPLFRVAEGYRQTGGAIPFFKKGEPVPKLRDKTFMEAIANAIPLPQSLTGISPGVNLTMRKVMVFDPAKGKQVVKLEPVILNPRIEALKFWAGANLKEIDPTQYGMFKKRQLDQVVENLRDAKHPDDIQRALDRLGQVNRPLARRIERDVNERAIRLNDAQLNMINRLKAAAAERFKREEGE